MRKWYDACRNTPSAVLLFVQLAGIVIYPYLGDEGLGRAAVGIFGLLVLGLAVAAVRMTPALTWVALTLGLPVVALTLLEGVMPENDGVVLVSAVFHAAFYFYTAYALIKYMFEDDHASRDELWATGSTFTVVAWGFAYVFVAVQIVWPGSFTAAVDPDGRAHLGRAAVPLGDHAEQHRALRHRADHPARPVVRDARADRRDALPRAGGLADGRADHAADRQPARGRARGRARGSGGVLTGPA